MSVRRSNMRLILWGLMLTAAVLVIPHLDVLFRLWLPDAREVIYRRDSFVSLLGNHLAIVTAAGLIATLLGVGAGIAVTRHWGKDFLPLVAQLASIGQTFPPVAVLALSVPALGFGTLPTIIALVLYGLLPIVRNTLAGLQGIDDDVMEAARGMGMSSLQRLWQVELPLSSDIILAGIRTSVTINIATAAIGSTIGAKTLGDPLIAGIVNGNGAYVIQGAIVIALLALCVDSLFERIGCALPSYDQGRI